MTAATVDLKATVAAILGDLEALGVEQVRERNTRLGAGANQFGVRMGDIRKVAAKHKNAHELSLALWETGNLEAGLLATLLVKPAKVSGEQLDNWVRTATFPQLADWLNSYVVKKHPAKESLREGWMDSDDPWAARAGWNLTAARVAQAPEGLDQPGLLDRLEAEMPGAQPPAQWTMNNTLAGIGIHTPELRARALEIGETLGIYRDYPVSKGCTSPFAPLWIEEMVSRQEASAG